MAKKTLKIADKLTLDEVNNLINEMIENSGNGCMNTSIKFGNCLKDENILTLPYNFYGGSAVVLNGEIHILGSNYSDYHTNHYKWDGTSWVSVSTLPYDFYNGSAVVLNGEIHILGGGDSGNYTKHYKWDGSSWVSVSTLPYNFSYGSAVVLNGEIHILGSGNSSDYTKHFMLISHYKKLALYLFKGNRVNTRYPMCPISNCHIDGNDIVADSNGVVELGINTTDESGVVFIS